jgi:hypothetical protein
MLALGPLLLRQSRQPALPLLLRQCRQVPLRRRHYRKTPKTVCKSYKAASIRSFWNGWRLRRRKQLPT